MIAMTDPLGMIAATDLFEVAAMMDLLEPIAIDLFKTTAMTNPFEAIPLLEISDPLEMIPLFEILDPLDPQEDATPRDPPVWSFPTRSIGHPHQTEGLLGTNQTRLGT